MRSIASLVRALTFAAALALTACGTVGGTAEPSGGSGAVTPGGSEHARTAADLDGLRGELILTRQRDLLDRGRINVLVSNDSGQAITVTRRQLVADFFETQPAERRTAVIDDGRRLAIQVPYGTVADCRTDRAIAASFAFTFTTDADPRPRQGSLAVGGADILDDIRDRQCTTLAFRNQTASSLGEVEIADGTVVAQLIIDKTSGGEALHLGGVQGTILVAVRVGEGYDGATLDGVGDRVAIPVRFVVNRCDPHALAEVTKRFGFDLEVAVGGRDPVPVAIDIGDIEDELEAIVRQCRSETATADA